MSDPGHVHRPPSALRLFAFYLATLVVALLGLVALVAFCVLVIVTMSPETPR